MCSGLKQSTLGPCLHNAHYYGLLLDSHHCYFYSTFVPTLEPDNRITLVDLVECSACFMLIYFFNSFIDPEVLHPHLTGHDLIYRGKRKQTGKQAKLLVLH